MAIIRTAKGLQEVQDTTLRDRLNQLNAPQVTSATAAQSIGATPKQQDMAGTQARKTAVIQENLAPKQDQLNLSDRYAQKSASLTGQQQTQLTEAQKLAKLAGLDTRVQKLTENRINQAAAAPVELLANQSELSKAIPSTDPRYAQASQALKDYANDPTKQEQALVTLQNLGIAPAQINNLLETTDAALGRASDVTQLKGSDLDADIRDMGYAGGILELSQQLGKDVGSLGIEDLTKEIQAYRNKVTSEKEKLEAQALNQTGIQQQAAMGQLKSFTQAGGVGQEQQVEQDLKNIDMASTVKVGDQDMRVDQLLQDQEFSDLIEQWVISSPEEREKLIPSAQFGPFVQWMTQNEASIKQAATAGQQAQTAFNTTEAGVRALGKDVLQDKAALSKLVPGYDPGKSYTAAELADMDTKLKASPVYQFAQSSPEGRTYINSFKPDELDQVAGMSTQQLQQQATTYNMVKGSPGLQSRYDLDPSKKVYSQSELQSVENFSKLPDYIQSVGTDPDFKGLTIDQLKYFDKNGQLNGSMVEEFKQFLAEQKAVASDNDQSAVNAVFGGTAETLNARYADLKSRAEYGDPEAIAALKDFDVMDTNDDGKIDATDARKLAADRKAALAGKDADYFKQQYGTGASGFETLGEKNNKVGTKIASTTGSGIYADVGLQSAMKTGNFDTYVKDNFQDPKAYTNLETLFNNYQKSGLGDTPTLQRLQAAMGGMRDSYIKALNDEAIPFFNENATPADVGAYMKLAEKYKRSNHPLAKEAAAIVNTKLQQYANKRVLKELPTPSKVAKDGFISMGTAPGYDAFMSYWGPGGTQNISVATANAFRDFMSAKVKQDPSYTPNFTDNTKRKDLEAFMKSRGLM